ncbi:integrase, catalytic region, zinc finger, CCHC-type containing protein [Tanacetum coccineum]
MFNMKGKIFPIIKTYPVTKVPSGNRLNTISVPAIAPSVETRMRYSIAKYSLIKAHINSYGHPFNPPNFAFIVEIVMLYLDYGCSKHMTGHCDKLINFVSKFIGVVRFENDHFVAIIGYRDLQIGNILISRVYYVEGLGHNLFFIGQFCDSDLEVAFRKHTRFVRNIEESQIGNSKKECHKPKPEPSTNEKLQMLHMDLCGPIRVERINGKRYILVIVDDHSPLHGDSILKTKDGKSEDLEKMKPKANIEIFIGYSPSKKAYRIYNKRTILIMETIHDLLFQPMFDEYFKPPSVVSTTIFATTLPLPDTAMASSSTTIDQDAPSLSTSPTTKTTASPINSTNVEQLNNEEDAVLDSDTFTNLFAPPVTSSAESSERIVIPKEARFSLQPSAVLDQKLVKRRNRAAMKVLVQWKGQTTQDATWEFLDELKLRFPDFSELTSCGQEVG